jgi:hypothetical protein
MMCSERYAKVNGGPRSLLVGFILSEYLSSMQGLCQID